MGIHALNKQSDRDPGRPVRCSFPVFIHFPARSTLHLHWSSFLLLERQEDQSNRIHDPVDDALHRLPPAASGGCSKANRAHGDSRWIVGNRIRFIRCYCYLYIDRGAAHALQRQSEAKQTKSQLDRSAGRPGQCKPPLSIVVHPARGFVRSSRHTATPIVVLVAS